MSSARSAKIDRQTKETEISLSINLDGNGSKSIINTSVPFFDHMLVHISTQGNIDISVEGKGDTDIDSHHLVEDTGIVFAQVLKKALGDFSGITRYGHFTLPMDEALVSIAIDLSGRSHLAYNVQGLPEKIGDFDTELVKEFFRALASNVPMTIHVNLHYGENGHHILEGIFKCFGRALSMAASPNPKLGKNDIPSSKGVI